MPFPAKAGNVRAMSSERAVTDLGRPDFGAPPPAASPSINERVERADRWRARFASLADERLALLLLLAGSAAVFLWNLGASGWANAYYSAAVLAGARDWTAMLFGSFDAGNAITVDKTPAALWIMSLSVRIFGFSSWSVLVPQALEGVAAVWLLYLTVRRRAGPMGGLIAGAVLALTPVATLMFRFNNPDALLTLLLVAAAYATLRALEAASTRWLVLAGACIGFAFLAKMLQGFVVIPAFTGVYLVAAPTGLWRRVRQVSVAAITVLVSAGWWVALVTLWPAAARPYIGGSQTNSIIDLMLGYNGLGRITGDEVGRVGGGGAGFGGSFGDGAGWWRLFQGEVGSEVSWLLPAALIALVALLWATRGRPRTDLTRAHALLWGGWLLTTGIVFSLMQGIFHPYYTVALVPAIGALVGMGVAIGWARRGEAMLRVLLAAIIGASAIWTSVLLGRSPTWNPWLTPLVVAAAALALLSLLLADRLDGILRRLTIAAALASLLAAPALGSIATAAEPHTGAIPSTQPIVQAGFGQAGGRFNGGRASGANPRFGGGRFGRGGIGQNQPPPGLGAPFNQAAPDGFGRPSFGGGGVGAPGSFGAGRGGLGGLLDASTPSPQLVAALQANAGAYRWVAATTGSNNAAGLALASRESVMAIGGFNGTDPSPTLAEFQAYVAEGAIHYYVAGGDAGGFRGAQGGSRESAAIAQWVASTFSRTTIGRVTVYDLGR